MRIQGKLRPSKLERQTGKYREPQLTGTETHVCVLAWEPGYYQSLTDLGKGKTELQLALAFHTIEGKYLVPSYSSHLFSPKRGEKKLKSTCEVHRPEA